MAVDKTGRAQGPLTGLLVLDLTQVLAGPYASMMMADQGARVIKIEPPGGDRSRSVGPWPAGSRQVDGMGYGAYYASINRGKESLVIDLKTPEGREVFTRLVKKADILVENYRAGTMEKLGLAYEKLVQINPRLIYASIRGFGDARGGESPYINWPAYDPIAQAMGGIMGITGNQKNGIPTKVGPGVGDIVPALFLTFGIVSAAWNVERTGVGQYIDVAMVDAVLALCERIIFQYDVDKKAPGIEGNGHPMLCPFGTFKARDGYVALSMPQENFWKEFCLKIGQPELIEDARFCSNRARVSNRELVEQTITAWTSTRSKQEICEILGGLVPIGPVYDAADIYADPHFSARDMLKKVEYPGSEQPLTIANTPIRMSRTPGGVRKRAPIGGENTMEILQELGYDESNIAAMAAKGVVNISGASD